MTDLAPALPDAEALLSQFLRAQDEVIDVLGDDDGNVRVYTAIPKAPTYPLVVLTRVSGSPVLSRPLMFDNPRIQLEAIGETKKQAQTVIELVRSVIAMRVEGAHELGLVTGCRFGPMSWLPDDSYPPTRHRYVADVELYTRPRRAGVGS